jgi:catechol 2,3-dioxygenase-like lactoylglutathione lyase family enzyme
VGTPTAPVVKFLARTGGYSVPHILGIDHVAVTAHDLEATCAFHERLFGARTRLDYAPDGKSLVRNIALGGALLSIHQAGNGLELVARQPTVGGADICLRWSGTIEGAADSAAHARHPDHRRTLTAAPPTGFRSFRSIYGIRTAICWSSWRRAGVPLGDRRRLMA